MLFKIPNTAVKCSRSLFLFHYITLRMVKNTYKSYDVYTMNFLKVCLTIHNISVLYLGFTMFYC